jgi:hypothetical protein
VVITDKPLERRKRKRLKLVCDAVAFVRISRPDCLMVARIIDISHHGLTIRHFGDELPPHTLLELDIVLPGGEAFLAELPGVTIWDAEIQSEARGHYPTRQCGIEFRNLTDAQKSYVQSLIRHYTRNNQNDEKVDGY